jgi:hypothetical protein
MMKPNVVPISRPPFIAASDEASFFAIEAALADVGISSIVRVRLSKDAKEIAASEKILSPSDGTQPVRLLLAIDKDISPSMLDSLHRIVETGGWVGVWSRADKSLAHDAFDMWLCEQMSAQQGAALHNSLSVLAAAMRLHALQPNIQSLKISVGGKPSGVLDRLKRALVENGFEVTAGKKAFVFGVGDKGEVFIGKDFNADSSDGLPTGVIDDPMIAASALKLVCLDSFVEPVEDVEVKPRQKDIDLIVQPPPRLLSEPTSKKLFAAFGMSATEDQLCRSATEAARFISGRDSLSVFKLAKPRLERKQEAGAVILGVNGAAGARRALQVLESLGESMGPPPPLGILVCPQVDGGFRVWLKMQLHPTFGRVVLVGAGDRSDTAPIAAFKAPVSSTAVFIALIRSNLSEDISSMRKIARSVSRFSRMIHTLSGRINRAEIHPLVASDNFPDALVLDALAAVGPDEP